MKIFVVGPFPKDKNLAYTGPMRVVYNLVKIWQSKGIEVITRPKDLNKVGNALSKMKYISISIPTKADIYSIHNFTITAFLITVIGLLRKKKIQITAHGLISVERKMEENHPFWKELIEKSLFKISDKIVTISNKMKRQIIETHKINPRKIQIIPHGVEKNFYFRNIKNNDFSDTYNLKGKIVVSFVGCTKKLKNVLTLLKAITEIENIDWVLFVIGFKGNQQDELEDYVGENGLKSKVYFTGPLNQRILKSAYKRTDIFVLPSHYEPFGLVALEAMAAKTVVLVSNQVGMSYIVKNGINGYIFQPDNIENLSSIIKMLLENSAQRKKIAENAYLTAKKHTWERAATKYLKLYRSLLR
jgi:glycosyltransferase involved in cell wall biosynthesis